MQGSANRCNHLFKRSPVNSVIAASRELDAQANATMKARIGCRKAFVFIIAQMHNSQVREVDFVVSDEPINCMANVKRGL